VNAGLDFTINCLQNQAGATIGMTAVSGVTYQWSNNVGLSSGSVSNPIATPTTTTTYTLTATNIANGCTAQDAVTVTVNTTPPVANAGPGFTKKCNLNQNGSLIGVAGVTGVNYSWTPSTGLNSATAANPTANPLVTTTYNLVATNTANGCTASATTTVIVDTVAPVANAGPDLEINCNPNQGGPVTIGMTSVNGINYAWNPTTQLTNPTAATTTANPASTITYNLTATNPNNGCTDADAVTVTVNTALPTANAGTDFTIKCNLNPTGLVIGSTPLNGFSYAWSPTTGLSNPNIANPHANPSSTTLYTLTVTNLATGCSATDQINVTVDKTPPVADAGNPFTIDCIMNQNGGNIGATPVANVTYAWTPSAGLNSPNIANPFAHPSTTTTYFLTATNSNNGCTATSQVLISVNNTPPTVNAGQDFLITCQQALNGAVIGMAAAPNVLYTWSSLNGLSGLNDQTSTQPIANPSVTTTYTLTAVDPVSGCEAKDSVLVSVNKTPPIVNAGPDKTITCNQNASGASIGMLAQNNVTYGWSPSTGIGNVSVSNPTAFPSTTTQYILTATNNVNGCIAKDTVVVNVNNTYPLAVSSQGFTKTCSSNASGALIGSAAQNGIDYLWSPSTGLTSATISNPQANPSSTTNYTVQAINTANGCITTTNVQVIVNTTPPTANAGPDKLIGCTVNPLPNGASIGMTTVANVTYLWSPATGLSNHQIANPSATPSNTQTYTLTATNTLNGCQATDQVVVSVNTALPSANAGQDFLMTCVLNANGDTLGVPAVSGFSYSWSPTTDLSNSTIAQPIATPTVTTSYILTVTNDVSGCFKNDTVVVTVDKNYPIANAGNGFVKTCLNNNNGPIQVGMPSVAGIQYVWTPALGLTSDVISDPLLNATVSNTYTLTASNPVNGCVSSDTIQVVVNQVLPAPNAGVDQNITCSINPNGINLGTTNLANHTYSWSPATGLSSATVYNPLATPTVTTTYILTLTNTLNGCFKKDTVTVNVDKEVPLVNAGPDLLKSCTSNTTGANIGMTAVVGVNYAWTPATGLTSPSSATTSANPNQTTTYLLTATDNSSGCSASDAMVFNYNFTFPSVNAGLDFTINCTSFYQTGSTIGFAGNQNNTYAWTPTAGLLNNSASSTIANPSQTTMYTLSATHPVSGCISKDSVLVTVDTEIPAVSVGNPFTKTCLVNVSGAQIGMAPITGVTYSWNTLTGLTLSTASQGVANPIVTTTYTLTAQDNSSHCTNSASVLVTVITTPPNANAGQDIIYNCNNQNTNILLGTPGTAGFSYSWTPTTGIINHLTAQPTLSNPTTNTYTLTVTNDQTGCTATDAVQVTVNTVAPPVNAGTDKTVTCTQNTGALTLGTAGNSNFNYNWTPNTFLNSNTLAQPTANVPVTTTYTLTVTNPANGCTSSDDVTITVNNTPPVANAGTGGTITCVQSAPIVLGISGTSGLQYNWTPSTGLAATNVSNPTVSGIQNTTTFVLTVTDPTNSCTDTAQVNVYVNNTAPVVDANIVGNGQTICAGTAITLFGSGTAGTTYTWNNGVLNNQAFTPTSTATYTVTGTNTTNSCTATDVITITVNPIPTVDPIPSIVRCAGTASGLIQFTGSIPGTDFHWVNSNPAINLAASNVGNISSFTVSNTTPNVMVATITVTPKYTNNGVTCTGTPQSFTITVNPIPTVNPVSSITRCHGTTVPAVNFQSSFAATNTIFEWQNSNVNIGTGLSATGVGNMSSFTANNTGTSPIVGIITVTPKATNAQLTCSGTPINFPITINPIPNVNAVASQVVCNNASTTAIDFTSLVPNTTFSWTNSNNGINLALNGSDDIASFVATNNSNVAITGNFVVTPTFTNAGGSCVGPTASFSISVNPTPTVSPISNQNVCVGSQIAAVNFTSSNNVTGTIFNWTSSNTTVLPNTGPGNIPATTSNYNGTSPITTTVSVTPQVVLGGVACNGTSQNFSITLNPVPTVNDPSNLVLCHNENSGLISFSGTVANATYTWTNNTPSINLTGPGTNQINSFVALNTTSAPVTATITVTPTFGPSNAICTGMPETFTITVNPIPNIVSVANQSVCVGQLTQAVNFSSNPTIIGTEYHWSNTNPNIGLAAGSVGAVPAFNGLNSGNSLATGVVTVTPKYTNLNHLCTGAPITFNLNIIPTPTVNDPSDIVVCNNAAVQAINFTGNVANTNYGWQNNNISINLAASGPSHIPTFNATNSGTSASVAQIVVTPTFTNGSTTCAGIPQDFTITVNPTPTVNSVSSVAYCVGSTTAPISFSSTAGVSGTLYTWQNSNTNIGLGASNTGTIPVFTASNLTANQNQHVVGNITVTPSATNAGITCNGTPTNFSITVNPVPNVNQVANQVKCNGTLSNAINFSGTVPGTTFEWTNNNASIGLAASGSGDINAFTLINTTNAPVTATIVVTPKFTLAGTPCFGNPSTFTITVNPTPTVNQIQDLAICANTSSTIIPFTSTLGVSGTSYAWTNNNTATGIQQNGQSFFAAFNATNTTAGVISSNITVTPSATFSNVTCTGSPMSFVYFVNPIPTVNNPLDQVLCHGNQTQIVNFTSNVSGAAFDWTANNTAIGIQPSGTGNIGIFGAVNTTTTAQTSTVEVIPSFTNLNVACFGQPQNMVFTVNPIPYVQDPTNQVVCAGQNTLAVNFVGNATNYAWSNSNPSIGIGASGNGNINPFVGLNSSSTAQTANITVTPQFNNAGLLCPGTPEVFSITIQPTPVVSFSQASPQAICSNTTTSAVTISSPSPNASFTWDVPSVPAGITGLNQLSGTGVIPSFTLVNSTNLPITINFIVSVSAGGGACPGVSATYSIVVNPSPTAAPTNPVVVCNGGLVSNISFSGTGTSYAWANNLTSIGLNASGQSAISAFNAINNSATIQTATITVTPIFAGSGINCNGPVSTFTITVNPTPTVVANNDFGICDGSVFSPLSFAGSATSYTWTNSNLAIGLGASGPNGLPSFSAVNNSTTPVTATINVTPFFNNGGLTCTGAVDQFVITVNPTPTVSDPSDQVRCNQAATAAVNFIGNGTSYQWTNSTQSIGLGTNGIGNILPFTAINNTASPVVANIAVTPYYSGAGATCQGTPQNFTIIVTARVPPL